MFLMNFFGYIFEQMKPTIVIVFIVYLIMIAKEKIKK